MPSQSTVPAPAAATALLVEGNEARVYESLVARADLPGFRVWRELDAVVLHSTAVPTALIVNRVIGWGTAGHPDEAFLEHLLSIYGDAGFGIELSAPAATAPVLGWLKARRFHRLGSSQMMVCDAPQPAKRYDTWAQSSGLRVEQVGPEHAATVAALCCEHFKVPAQLQRLLQVGMLAEGWRRWLAYDGDTPVGASLSHVRDGLGWFGWTSVNPSHRGRWVQAGFVARQLEEAVEAGCRCVTTDTTESTKARPDPVYLNLKRFGFVAAYVRPMLMRAPVRRCAASGHE